MSAQYCSHCGAPVSAGATFCAYCGASVGTPGPAPGAPLPAAAPPAPPPAPTLGPGPGGPRRNRRLVVLVIIVVVVIVLAGIIYYASTAPVVNITQLNVYAPDNVCGLNTNPIYYEGYSDDPGASDALGLQVENFNNTSCTLHEVTTNTTGFTLSDVGVPLVVAAVGNNTLNLTLTLPSGAFSGAVNLIYT
jgi:hypothetical protein